MYLTGLFRRKISIKEGEKLLTEYCEVNGFEDNTTQWKKPSHSKHWFAYKVVSNRKISRNWVSYHHIRGSNKYSIWIDLVNERIVEILRPTSQTN